MFGVTVHIVEPGFHKTPIIDPDVIGGSVLRSWDSVPKEKKNMTTQSKVTRPSSARKKSEIVIEIRPKKNGNEMAWPEISASYLP